MTKATEENFNEHSTYWNDRGKYQEQLDWFNSIQPDYGCDTSNDLVNLGIALSKVYYDVYNNDGYNLKGDFTYIGIIARMIKDVALPIVNENDIPLSMRLDTSEETLYRNFMNLEKLEKLMDSYLDYIQDKDLTIDEYITYFDSDDRLLSREPFDGCRIITFSDAHAQQEWERMFGGI